MEDTIQYILHKIFAFSYPLAFVGAIFYSINQYISIDFLSAFVNRPAGLLLNIYLGICGYIAFCTFYKIEISVNDRIFDFEHVYISFDHFNDTFNIPGLNYYSLTG